MPYEQVENILKRAERFHHKLAEFYRELDDTAENEDEVVKMIITYLREHEEKLERKLAEFGRSAFKNIMDTWVQFPPAEHLDHIIDHFDRHQRMSVNDLIGLALQFDNALLDFYREAAEGAPTERVKEMFETLFSEGRNERRKLVSAVFDY